MKTRESEEMYLETILVLKHSKGNVRALDIAEHLNYSKPSVSRALGLLKGKGYITIDDSNMINFSVVGEKKAKTIYERHSILTDFLISIGATHEVAEDNACRIEHVITDELLDIIKKNLF